MYHDVQHTLNFNQLMLYIITGLIQKGEYNFYFRAHSIHDPIDEKRDLIEHSCKCYALN